MTLDWVAREIQWRRRFQTRRVTSRRALMNRHVLGWTYTKSSDDYRRPERHRKWWQTFNNAALLSYMALSFDSTRSLFPPLSLRATITRMPVAIRSLIALLGFVSAKSDLLMIRPSMQLAPPIRLYFPPPDFVSEFDSTHEWESVWFWFAEWHALRSHATYRTSNEAEISAYQSIT